MSIQDHNYTTASGTVQPKLLPSIRAKRARDLLLSLLDAVEGSS